MLIYLLRHGLTEYNAEKRYQGQRDIPLSAAGRAVLWRYHAVACKQFGGITGDLAGWFLQKTESWMLAALCACQWGGLL